MIPLLILATLIATPLDLSALSAMKDGDTVAFFGATFDHVTIKNRVFAIPVTLDFTRATAVNLTLQDVSGVNETGGVFNAKPKDYLGGFYVLRGKHVHATGMTINASDGPGAMVKDSSDVVVDLSAIDKAHTAIAFVNTDGFRASGNDLTGMSGDGIDAYSSWRGQITYNGCARFRVLDLSHRDCIQASNTIPGAAAVSELEIAHNSAHGAAQGVGAYSHSATDPGYKGLSIHDNDTTMADPNGVAVQNCDGCSIRNNRSATLPGSRLPSHIWITGSINTDKCGNISFAYGPKADDRDPDCPR